MEPPFPDDHRPELSRRRPDGLCRESSKNPKYSGGPGGSFLQPLPPPPSLLPFKLRRSAADARQRPQGALGSSQIVSPDRSKEFFYSDGQGLAHRQARSDMQLRVAQNHKTLPLIQLANQTGIVPRRIVPAVPLH